MRDLDIGFSKELAELVDAKSGMCASNVARLFMFHRDALPLGSVYAEGAWVVEGQFDLHAWIEDQDRIIDPTYVSMPLYRRQSMIRRTKIIEMDWELARSHYLQQDVASCKKLDLILNWDDERVEAVRAEIDPP